ncbi:hypothetical protein ACFQI7_15910 [Paenibacillus allorhizosphaerae]|uniref:Uncharacterized protein n=1 Tax=Paenibacillus allorhizosphaerae TaxID=2849866 RepID=A0ABM8VE13_9BACL|nr:hypothetical protein [Paenibacillus allorhizosphaerae]CAG7629479.1 hypothetical protein PAECIP111802_01559 [Paenibacillus allorhizosphaerae]
MIQYGSSELKEIRFANMRAMAERRGQWLDIEVSFDLTDGSELPEELEHLTALLICTHDGAIVQFVPQDEGRDCEFQFTELEKEQLRSFYESNVLPRLSELVR